MKPTEVLEATKNNLNREMELIRSQQNTIVSVDELKFQNKKNSEIITLTMTNSSDSKDITLVFGTPLSLFEEYAKVPLYSSVSNHFLDNLASLSDNQGAQAPFFQLLNRRFCRKTIILLQTEVITPNTEVGLAQRTEQFQKIFVPYNSASDSSKEMGAYVPQYTEYTASLLQTKALVIGDFSGVMYKLLKGSTVSINMILGGVDAPSFSKPL